MAVIFILKQPFCYACRFASMPPNKKLKAANFLKKDVDGMVKRLFEDEDDCHDCTVEEAIKKLKDGIHLSYKDTV